MPLDATNMPFQRATAFENKDISFADSTGTRLDTSLKSVGAMVTLGVSLSLGRNGSFASPPKTRRTFSLPFPPRRW